MFPIECVVLNFMGTKRDFSLFRERRFDNCMNTPLLSTFRSMILNFPGETDCEECCYDHTKLVELFLRE
jgi:hypothetical protein